MNLSQCGRYPILKFLQPSQGLIGTLPAFPKPMTIAANLGLANIEFGVSDAKQNPKSRLGTPQASIGEDRSFGERWQSLVGLDKSAAGKQVGAQAADLNQSPSDAIEDFRGGPGATVGTNHPRTRHQYAEGSRHKIAPSTSQQIRMGMIEADPAGTLPIPMSQWQAVLPERDQSINASQQASGLASISVFAAHKSETENLDEVNSVRQGAGDLRSLAAPPTEPMTLGAMGAIGQSAFEAPKASEANRNTKALENTHLLPEPGVAVHPVTVHVPGADNPGTNVAQPQIEAAAVASHPAASNGGRDIRNAPDVEIRTAATPNKGTASRNPSASFEQVGSGHLEPGDATHSLLSHMRQLSQQQSDAGLAQSSIVPMTTNREAGTSLSSQTPLSQGPSTTVHQTFAALDAENNIATSRWIHAGRNSAEAGFDDPVLGWVGVRAQAGPNGVHATVVPVSADAAQSLGAHLSGLTSYLSEHRTPVQTVTVSLPDSNPSQHSMGQRSGNPSEQGADQSRTPSQARDRSSAGQTPHHSAVALDSDGVAIAARLTAQGGTYVSVLA